MGISGRNGRDVPSNIREDTRIDGDGLCASHGLGGLECLDSLVDGWEDASVDKGGLHVS